MSAALARFNVQLIQKISASFQIHLHLVLFSGIEHFPVYTALNSHYFILRLYILGSTS